MIIYHKHDGSLDQSKCAEPQTCRWKVRGQSVTCTSAKLAGPARVDCRGSCLDQRRNTYLRPHDHKLRVPRTVVQDPPPANPVFVVHCTRRKSLLERAHPSIRSLKRRRRLPELAVYIHPLRASDGRKSQSRRCDPEHHCIDS
jgi:hypothetical protein